MVGYLWDVESADYEQQDAEGRAGHVLLSLRTLARWLDGCCTADLVLPAHLVGTLAPGRTAATLDHVLAELDSVSEPLRVHRSDHNPRANAGPVRAPAFLLSSPNQLYHPSEYLLRELGLKSSANDDRTSSPAVPGTWIGEIATDIDPVIEFSAPTA
ncbi:hypothetical protein [Nocardia sp. XZ_19_369]|uniref:hypothetical protein n=1 Tax=Nocardia sp. XZ_19_369 TaxID=2769487 RepID=UPI00188F750D|nr:hypothetical protein [Nocardia sp. XZ_19_369]